MENAAGQVLYTRLHQAQASRMRRRKRKMKNLTVKVNYSPMQLAEICRKHGAGSSTFSFAFCPFPGASCPLVNYKQCDETTAEDWEKVLQDEEPDAQFRFGDKVTHYVDIPVRAVFSAYKDSIYTGEAYVLFDGDPECQVVPLRNLKAGWHG